MSVKLLGFNMKWEWRRWWHNTAVPCGAITLIALVVLLIMPVPHEHWHGFIRSTLLALLIIALITAVVVAMYLMFVYPSLVAFRDLRATALLEHLTGGRYIHRLCVRLLINVVTFAAGFGIIWIGMLILQRFYDADIGWLTYLLADDNDPVVILEIAHLFIFKIPLMLLATIKLVYPFQNAGTRINESSSGGAMALFAALLIDGRLFGQSPTALEAIIRGTATAILIVAAVILISRKYDKTLEV